MRNLGRPLLRLLGRDDRGAIGILVAVLIGGGVLLGMAALVIDVGQIYQNRAELQNGADAGALAVARQCGLKNCTSTLNTAVSYASANASALTGYTAGVTTVCGHDNQDLTALNPCSASIEGSALTDCPKDPTNGASFVDVLTSTKLASGSTLLPPVFAKTLVGSASYDGTTVEACAQAEWGTAEQSDSLAMTISDCEWQDLTSSGSPFGTLVPVYLNNSNTKAKPCAGPAGTNIPGGFDWLQPTGSSPCTASIDLTTDTTYSNTGVAASNDCKDVLSADVTAYEAGDPVTVFLPIFGCPDPPVTGCPVGGGPGQNATYYIIGLAGFVITGYKNITGLPDLGTNSACTGNAKCIEGYFTPGLDPVSDYISPTPSPFDVTGIKLSG
jgi:Flp pilus assembly protein TadG